MEEKKQQEYSSPISGFGDQPDAGGPIHYGGQAVIEGVMMRGPTRVATAVRLPSGEIDVHEEDFRSYSRRNKFFRLPVVRGGLTLIESLALGIKALNYSASAAMEELAEDEREVAAAATDAFEAPEVDFGSEAAPATATATATADEAAAYAAEDAAGETAPAPARKKPAPSEKDAGWKTKAALTFTMIFAFALGLLFFFYIPLVLTGMLDIESGILFNVVDGIIRVTFFLIYIWAISRWKEMRRVFEYHGAEHKTIFMQEAGEELTPENAEKYTTRHPRCGTSFLLIVMVVSILVFMITGKPHTIAHRLMRFLLIPVIAGISYEIMKLAARKATQRWARILSAPGIWLQSITTKEPSVDQIEVAIAALSAVRIDPNDDREAPVHQS